MKAKARRRQWLLVAILLLGAGLRLVRLGSDSLWYDETVSVHLAAKSPAALIAHTAGDIHPPGYYLLLHTWTRLAGSSDFAVAFASLFFGVLLVALADRLGRRVFGPGAGVWSALLVAISPYNVWYSQEVRMYTLGAALAVGLMLAVLNLTPSSSRQQAAWRWLLLYAVCAALGLWTLYYFAFLLLAVNVAVGVWWLVGRRWGRFDWKWLGRWAVAQVLALVLYAPWLPNAWRQATQPPVPPWRGFTSLGALAVEAWSALSLGQSIRPADAWPALLLSAGLFGLGLVYRRREAAASAGRSGGGWGRWLLAAAVLGPVLLIYLASFVTPLYHVRYVFTYSVPFYVLCGAGLAWLAARWRGVAGLSLVIILAFSTVSMRNYHTASEYASDDHRAAVGLLAERWRPGDAILVNAGYAYTALATNWHGEPIAGWQRLVTEGGAGQGSAGGWQPVVYQTGTVDGEPSLGWGAAESDFYAMPRAEAARAMEGLFDAYHRVWVYRIYDTVTDPDGFLRSWLEEHGTLFEDQVFGGESQLRLQGYLTGRDATTGMEPREANLADGSLHLTASSQLTAAIEAGAALDLSLVWQVEQALQEDSILFAGLFDGEGRRWAQVDERPLGTLYPASAWAPGTAVRTPLRLELPSAMAPGDYALEVGWYRLVEGQPVWLRFGSGERLALGEVEVVAPQDWAALPAPDPQWPLEVSVGSNLRLLGFDASSTEAQPGQALSLALYWQALDDAPSAGPAVLRLQDDAGQVFAEWASRPLGGRIPFEALAKNQVLHDPRRLEVPGSLAPGVYSLVLGLKQADGTWSALGAGAVASGAEPAGSFYPLVTIRVPGRPLSLEAPVVQNTLEANFGQAIGLLGFDQQPGVGSEVQPGERLELTLYWKALGATAAPHKLFVHLVGEGGPSDIRVQADQQPRIPTPAWQPGEYFSATVSLDLPGDLPVGRYTLLAGWYDEATGVRLPVGGGPYADTLELGHVAVGD